MGIVTKIRIFVLTCFVLAGNPAFGQTLGSIDGEARDATGAAVAGVRVSATNTGANAARTAITNDAGAYSFPSLAPGTYTLRAEKPGFKAVLGKQIEPQVQQAARIDIELQVGEISESVQVQADAAMLAPQWAELSATGFSSAQCFDGLRQPGAGGLPAGPCDIRKRLR